jgi:hypothetical protein
MPRGDKSKYADKQIPITSLKAMNRVAFRRRKRSAGHGRR